MSGQFVLWKWEYEGGEMKKVWFNGLGWGRRSGARVYSEGDARAKKQRLPGSMIRAR